MTAVTYSVLWPAMGLVFLLTGGICLFGKKWLFAASLLLVGILVAGSWQYNRTHEKISKLQLALIDNTRVKEDRERPDRSIFHVKVTGLELGIWEGNLRAADIHLDRPGTIVVAELAERPLSGTYLKSIASLPQPKFTYLPPPEGREFDWAFLQPVPAGISLEHVLSTANPTNQSAKVALAFHTDRATFHRIRPPELEPIPFESFSLHKVLHKEVEWWRKTSATTEIFGRNAQDGRDYEKHSGDQFAHELIVLTLDADGLVQYLWWGRGLRKDTSRR